MRMYSLNWSAVAKEIQPGGTFVCRPGHSRYNWFKLSLQDSPETALFTIVYLIKGTFGDPQCQTNKQYTSNQGETNHACKDFYSQWHIKRKYQSGKENNCFHDTFIVIH